MNNVERRGRGGHRFLVRTAMVGVVGLASLPALPGCASRTLTLTQADYVNTRIHVKRKNVEDRKGEPLEVNIVCVYPSDLRKDKNALLAPDQNITSDVWFQRRPEVGKENEAGRFELPTRQIYVLTDDANYYGKRVGGRLCGAIKDKKEKILVKGIDFRNKGKVAGDLFKRRSVIYVFPKFLGRDGEILRVEPAKFNPPGDYRRDLFVEIGVIDHGGAEEQYIKNTTGRKMHKGGKKGG